MAVTGEGGRMARDVGVPPVRLPSVGDLDSARYDAQIPAAYRNDGNYKNLGSLSTLQYGDSIKWNPKPHVSTKTLPPFAYQNYFGKTLRDSEVQILENYSRSLPSTGFFYQDTYTASGPQTDLKKLYGFRFTYNPTTFGIQDTNDTTIDWTMAPAQKHTVLLTGTQNIGFTLYLNRIADMSALRQAKAEANYGALSRAYGGKISQDDIEGILERGTDYDLEFLYRVCNGEPKKGPAIRAGYTKGASSNFGWLAMTPVWLKLNQNMRFKGSITGMNIDHIMFTQEMIPMLTTVSISFARIPMLSLPDGGKAYQEKMRTDGYLQTPSTPEK